jgi:predicted aldo/keto reductase-like oxidoreductase
MNPQAPNRREFLKVGGASLAALSSSSLDGAQTNRTNSGGIPLRALGQTGQMVPILCLGGYHSTKHADAAESEKLIQRAVDEGITFLDNCWDYHDGIAEERMGKALAEGNRRDKVFLMTKCCGRTAKDAQSNLDDSLRRLKTDHIDLWQFHEIIYDNDPDWIFERSGALETALRARDQGKAHYIGFTGHKDPSIHLKMLGKPYNWSTVQMPLNVMDAHFRSFQKLVLPELVKRQIGVLGMKSLGGAGKIVSDAGIAIEDALRYVLSLPIASLVSGIDSIEVLEQNLKIAREFKPISAEDRYRIERKSAQLAGDGRYELFKTSKSYDGPVHRKQHGFATDVA